MLIVSIVFLIEFVIHVYLLKLLLFIIIIFEFLATSIFVILRIFEIVIDHVILPLLSICQRNCISSYGIL